MHGFGGERVIRSLLSYPCKGSAKTIIYYLPYRIKEDQEERVYKSYVTECLRIVTENTAKQVAMMSGGKEEVKYISVSFDDIINPKPVEEKTADEIINDIQAEFERLGFETK